MSKTKLVLLAYHIKSKSSSCLGINMATTEENSWQDMWFLD